MSQNNKKEGKSSSHHQKQHFPNSRSETSTDIVIPKLTFAPTSNFHKWKKQLLKQIKREYGPIYDSIISEKYPNFVQESMKLILSTPEETLKEMMTISCVKSTRRQSISAPGNLSFNFQSDRYSDDDSSSNASIEIPVKGPPVVQRRKAWDEDIEDELESTNLNVETLLKMSSASKSVSKKRDKSPPIQKRDKSPSEIKLTPQQIKLVENYIQGKQKIINDLELYFIKNLPAVCGMIIATLSVQAETKIRQHRQFDRAYGSDDVIRLMRIIQKCAVLTPLDVPNLANQLRKSRDKLYQGNKTLDYFCELFNQFEKDLIELERPTPEEDLIVTFLDHLHPSYCTIITQWRMNGIMPTAIDAVQYKLQQYESLAISQSSIMKVSHGKQSDAGVQDVAMIAQAAKGHQGSNKKGSSSNKGNQQQQQSSGNNNNKPKREPMTEERAKALGLKKLPCCGKYGSRSSRLSQPYQVFRF